MTYNPTTPTTMLNVNTIAFGGRKAVINSYSDHPAIAADIKNQRARWAARFPNATVKTERMSYGATRYLVGNPAENYALAWDIGKASTDKTQG